MALSMKAAAQPPLRLVVSKPEPDRITKDAEVLERILAEGFSYTRELCRDSVGCERPTLLVRMTAELRRGRNKTELSAFIARGLGGKSLHSVGTHSDVLCDIMMEAEEAGIVTITEAKNLP
ncbi:MAG TPA: hypothetical protein VLD37_05575 [Candidatus Bilamarchaeum sp.]|nr:hypothetical protein [Candidatus Bilamarchaeum sp.]